VLKILFTILTSIRPNPFIFATKCNRVGKAYLKFNKRMHVCYFGIEFQRIFKCLVETSIGAPKSSIKI